MQRKESASTTSGKKELRKDTVLTKIDLTTKNGSREMVGAMPQKGKKREWKAIAGEVIVVTGGEDECDGNLS